MPRPSQISPTTRKWLLVVVAVALVVVAVLVVRARSGTDRTELDLSEFERRIAAGEVATAEVMDRDNAVKGELEDGTEYEVSYPREYGEAITTALVDGDVEIETNNQSESIWTQLLFQLLPVVLLVGAFLWLISNMQGGGRLGSFSRTKAKTSGKETPEVTFADVAGCAEAIEELAEIRDFLAEPERFQALGAKIPKGVLLFGPPGTGKTLLARAVAGEAGAPFFSISGSDFVEMFVGVGASRVRDLFEQAKNDAPAIIFVDEIDAVGRHRGAGLGGGHDEREQTLNQLLVEMDGFDATSGVILIAATNRPDILDPALLRPGRFDRQIVVDQPDLDGRRAILEVHARGKPLGDDVDLGVLARRTPGFTGADLANMLNEAALLAARRRHEGVSMKECEEAIDRLLAGPERKSRVMSDREKRVIAYHEAGHALVGHVLPNTDPIHKISIIARGRALGWTLALPTEDRVLHTRAELVDSMAMLLGGRTAEEMIFGDPTTGAADDIERATRIARAMVTQFGMSDAIGPQQLGHRHGEPFLGREVQGEPDYSDDVAATIDAEVARLVGTARTEAREILTLHRRTLDRLADALVEHETLGDPELADVLAGAQAIDPDEPPADERSRSRPGNEQGTRGASTPQVSRYQAGSPPPREPNP
nr:ATP-dependent zinc metalloprotease FtsH [Rhabdothermincola salaria]